jgi:hypothetical protein
LKRGRGLRRKSELKRGEKGLAADPEKTRAFVERGRGQLDRGQESLRKTRKTRPAEGPLDPATWARTVNAASGWRSILPPHTRVTDADPPHHVIPKHELRKRRLWHLVWDPRNGVAVTIGEHDDHERANRRIPRSALPSVVFSFAAECGDWALDHIERTYPND